MNAAVKVAVVVAANLVIWPAAWTVFETSASTSPITGQRDARSGSALDQPDLGEALDFSAMSPVQAYSRPLFETDRRAWQPPEPQPPEPDATEPVFEAPQVSEMPAPSIRLVGISSSGPASMTALLQFDSSPEPVWVLVGDLLEGWEVGSIGTQSIMMRRGDQQMSFDLYPEVSSGQ